MPVKKCSYLDLDYTFVNLSYLILKIDLLENSNMAQKLHLCHVCKKGFGLNVGY